VKVSYSVLKRYIQDIAEPEVVAQDLVMHAAEVEGIEQEGQHLEKVFIGEVLECTKHPEADKLNICQVSILGETKQIICGAPNVTAGIKVAIATPGAELKPGFVISKAKIRGEESNGMICSEDELGLVTERQEGILILPEDAPMGMCARDYFGKNGVILEIDNKAINHRPDLFSHIGVAREIEAISGKKLNFEYAQEDFSSYPELGTKNSITDVVKRFITVACSNVHNGETPEEIKEVLASAGVESKGLLVDITNYSLYLYGQPTHCYDADKITGNIHVRYAKDGESFTALNDKTYTLTVNDIVIADDAGVIGLGGVIGGKESAVSETTQNIIIEAGWFDQAVVRKTGKNHGLRTDALNIFEKDIVCGMQEKGASLIVSELRKSFPEMTITATSDIYPDIQNNAPIAFDIDFTNRLIGANYNADEALTLLANLWITEKDGMLNIPFWRKDLTTKADIAEEIARIHGYDKVEVTVPRINLGAIIQTPTYKINTDTRNFLVARGFYDMYNYSFVNKDLMAKLRGNIENLVPLKNALSEEMTHMRGDLIPNLLLSLEENIREIKDMKLFEIGKIFSRNGSNITENYELAGVITHEWDNLFYETQALVTDTLQNIWIDKFHFEVGGEHLSYAHSGRTAKIVVRGKEIGYVWEIHPRISKNFDVQNRVGFYKINIDLIENSAYTTTKAKDISNFQENNFDLSFVVNKDVAGKDIQIAIEKTDTNLIQNVELFDIYEDEERLPGQRSLSFKVFIQSLDGTLDDSVKNTLIWDIVKRVEKKGGKLR